MVTTKSKKTASIAKKEKEWVKIFTPLGLTSFPYLLKPDVGRKESSNKFSIEIYVPKPIWKAEGKQSAEAVLKVARDFFKSPKMSLGDFAGFNGDKDSPTCPFTDMDVVKVKNLQDWQKGTIRIRAKRVPDEEKPNNNRPIVIGPKKDPDTNKFPEWTEEQIKAIKGGDYGRIIGDVYGFSQKEGGISIGLTFFQFGYAGKAIGQGRWKQVEDLTEIEVTTDSPDEMVDTEVETHGEEESDPAMDFG